MNEQVLNKSSCWCLWDRLRGIFNKILKSSVIKFEGYLTKIHVRVTVDKIYLVIKTISSVLDSGIIFFKWCLLYILFGSLRPPSVMGYVYVFLFFCTVHLRSSSYISSLKSLSQISTFVREFSFITDLGTLSISV